MISRTHCLLAVAAICLALAEASGQEGQPGSGPPGAPVAAGPNDKYVELSHSKDRVVKATAERYLNLVRFQEWGGATGKSQMAKYVSHDPDLKRVKLAVARGSGKDRVVKEYDVEVEKLNKTCQARVRQIDVLQKKLDELATNASALGDGVGGRVPEGPGEQEPEGRYADPGANPPGPGEEQPHPGVPPQAGPEEDPSASEPDPIGFAELPPVTPSEAGAGPAGFGSIVPADPAAVSGAAAPTKPGSTADRKRWRNSLASFAANIRVGTDPAGQPMVDWGELHELREMNDIVLAQQSPEPPARSPEAETPAAISERLGDLHWRLVLDKIEEAPGGVVIPTFRPVDLAKPLELHISLDDTEDVQKWARLAPGSSVKVAARLSISEPYKITAKVKLDGAK